MRLSILVLAASLSISLTAADARKFKMPPDFDYEEHYSKLAANPPYLSNERLPKGYKIGRCLLVVDGRTRISGPCAYYIEKGGNFHIDGPRQVYGGIDYPTPEIGAMEMSTDYWANVFKGGVMEDGQYKSGKGPWTGYANEDVRYTKGDGSAWYELVKTGACYSNETRRQSSDTYQQMVKVCLWKK
jgi:hypothetical protein